MTKVIWILAGGLMLLVVGFFGLRFYQFSQWRKHREPTGVDFFSAASRNIGPRGVAASGNSDRAKELAADMSKLMLAVRTIGFEQAKKKSALDTRDAFKTYCDLNSNQCVFLIHVPELRRFTQDAQESLGSHAWKSAQAVLQRGNAGRDGMRLAVGMMGLVSYKRVMLGRYVSEGSAANSGPGEVLRGFGCERSLYDWFTPSTNNLPAQAPSPMIGLTNAVPP